MSSAMAAAAFSPPWPESPRWCWPNMRVSRISETSVPSFMSWKYQAPSTVSPYSTVPTMRLSLSTNFL